MNRIVSLKPIILFFFVFTVAFVIITDLKADGKEFDEYVGEQNKVRKAVAKDAQRLVEEARELMVKGKFYEASRRCIAAGKKLEKLTGPYAELKRRKLGQFTTHLKRKWAEKLLNDARAAFLEKKYQEALDIAETAGRVDPAIEEKVDAFIEKCEKFKKSRQYNDQTALITIDPDNKIRKKDLAVLMREAEVYYKNRQFSLSRQALEKILVRDPYNLGATELLEKVYRKIYDTAKKRREIELLERMTEVEWKWNEAVLPTEAIKPKESGPVEKEGSRSGLFEKLNKIVFDLVEFDEASITSVVAQLKRRSKQLDPEGAGVNIILQLSPELKQAVPRVSMTFDQIPMAEVIRYLCQGAGLKFRVEEQAVLIGDKDIDDMDTRFFNVRAELISGIISGANARKDAEAGGEGGGDFLEEEDLFSGEDTFKGSGESKSLNVTASSEALKKYFIDRGVPFEDGATVAYDRRSGQLIVKNTPENLRKLEFLLRELDINKPMVLIEAKILEITQTDMEELGFDWVFSGGTDPDFGGHATDWAIAQTQKILRSYSNNSNMNSTDSSGNVTRYRIINDLQLLPNVGDSNEYNLSLTVNAIDRSGRAEVLSAPKVIASSGTLATIRMVNETYYPESWTDPETSISESIVSYTPSYPEFGDPTDIGIRFEVTPTVFSNNYTIMLELNPQVVSFVTWTDYSYQVRVGNVESRTALLIMPEISRRDLQAKIKVFDGETVVLGGMLRDRNYARNDKWPLLGDLPLIGRAFSSQFNRTEKTNLLIFVTCRLMNNDGIPVRRNILRGLPEFNR